MKFSVEVETESRTYDRVGFSESPSPRHLQWNIKVDIHQNILIENKENIEVSTPRKKVGIVEAMPRKESKQFGMETKIGNEDDNLRKRSVAEESSGRVRKMSRLEREEELVRQAMRKSSRKVSREGEWLVLREKTGLLTTQNGTQQIHERRIKISEGELSRFCENEI